MTYYCYEGSRYQINDELYQRNLPSSPPQMTFSPRAVQTRFVMMPLVDCRRKSGVPIVKRRPYDHKETYLPTREAPYSGYAKAIDIETILHNTIFPIQKASQSKFIPSSQSDLYQLYVKNGRPVRQTHPALFKEQRWNRVNRDKCGLGHKFFDNHTKYQVKGM